MRNGLIALAMVALPTASSAHHDECHFTLTSTGEHRVVAFHDAGDPGAGVGDMRVGVRKLVDEHGEPAGTYRWYILPIDPAPPAGGTGAAVYRGYFLLKDGMIMTETAYEPVVAVENTKSVSVPDGERAVLGGSGKYREANGSMLETVFVRDGASGLPLKKTFEFFVNCDH